MCIINRKFIIAIYKTVQISKKILHNLKINYIINRELLCLKGEINEQNQKKNI